MHLRIDENSVKMEEFKKKEKLRKKKDIPKPKDIFKIIRPTNSNKKHKRSQDDI